MFLAWDKNLFSKANLPLHINKARVGKSINHQFKLEA